MTPLALATAPIATQDKVPMIVMAAATSIITEQSPFLQPVRDTAPDAVFVFVPSGVGASFAKQFSERGWTSPVSA